MDICDMTELRPLLERHGFTFNKSIGQNFLSASWVPEKIAEAAGLDMHTSVLEIGPGAGCLTAALAKMAKKVVALELDKRLLPVLSETLSGYDNIEVVQGDALKTDLVKLVLNHLSEPPRVAAANLPYYITAPAVTALLETGLFGTIIIMVQDEVARKLCAAPGSTEYGVMSVITAYYGTAETIARIPAGCFYPVPKVASAVVRLSVFEDRPTKNAPEAMFFRLVKAAFAQRRKTLLNALASNFEQMLNKSDVLGIITACGINEDTRGERLSAMKFLELATRFVDFFGIEK